MITNVIPAAAFTAATAAPSLLASAAAVLHWLGQHPAAIAVPATVAVVLLIAWAFAREASRPGTSRAAQSAPMPSQPVIDVVTGKASAQ